MIDIATLDPVQPGPLAAGDVDLWCFFYEGVALDAYEPLMTADERARHLRFHFQKDRDIFLATRALVRTVLSQYADVRPEEWRFDFSPQGKPFARDHDIHFNLTNTRGLVACAVAGGTIGVDAERIEDRGDLTSVARHFFAPREVEQVDGVQRFFEIWTLKESYVKAHGAGLGLPLDQFWFDDEARIHGIEDAERWRFASLRASHEHVLAVAADTAGAPLRLRASRFEGNVGRAFGPPSAG